MPEYVRHRAQDLLNRDRKALNGATVLLVGVTYKPNIADERESPVRPLARGLFESGAIVQYHDAFVPAWNIDSEHGTHDGDRMIESQDDLYEAAAAADLVILLQPHKQYDLNKLQGASKLLLDTRGLLTGDNVERL